MEHQYRSVICLHCGYSFRFPVYCGNRFCDVCSLSRNLRVRDRLRWLLGRIQPARGYRIRFLTLTIPNSEDLVTGIDTLVRSFRRFRQRAVWRRYVLGGIYILEVTGRPGNWHCHLHALIESRYFPVQLISRIWAKVSPGKVVWITNAPLKAATAYLTTYLTKSDSPAAVTEIKGRALSKYRLFSPFGSWHSISKGYHRQKYQCPMCHTAQWSLLSTFGYTIDHNLPVGKVTPRGPPLQRYGT